ncbi:MAG: 16S rRNA (guanine(527)-N(7))-methyltransferase RsmG [Pirellulaceae bacterium]|jgi:16S rRNA (guanine527-N7)-methyltransferase|nr:16S rRNA (guanine(527)-N(7))-methyltransferase RsmG [Pirellulaceae bacterium]HJN12561.1 16S rRNA (guanine(527)-N(7))-methyltransferase RsmG [Pirellulaceae bacterium]
MDPRISAEFTAELAKHQIVLDDAVVAHLNRYCDLLWDWNTKLNLTRHSDFEKFVGRDLTDSLQLAQLVEPGERVLDVGSGGGVPGIVLAILRPDLQLSLCESVAKKAGALEAMCRDLQLDIPVFPNRVEKVLVNYCYDVVTARAVGSLSKMLKWLEPHWGSFGRLLAFKGPRWVAERGEARHLGFFNKLQLRLAVQYDMPGTDSKSVILKIWPKESQEPADE